MSKILKTNKANLHFSLGFLPLGLRLALFFCFALVCTNHHLQAQTIQGTLFEDPLQFYNAENEGLWNPSTIDKNRRNLGIDYRQSLYDRSSGLKLLDVRYHQGPRSQNRDTGISWGLHLRFNQSNFFTEQIELAMQAGKMFNLGESTRLSIGVGAGLGNRLINFSDGPQIDSSLSTKQGKFFPEFQAGLTLNIGGFRLSAAAKHLNEPILKYTPQYQPKVDRVVFFQVDYLFEVSEGLFLQPKFLGREYSNAYLLSDLSVSAFFEEKLELQLGYRLDLGAKNAVQTVARNETLLTGINYQLLDQYFVSLVWEYPATESSSLYRGALQAGLKWIGK